MLEGHVAGGADPEEAAALGRHFPSWPTPFVNEAAAPTFLGGDAIVDARIDDFEDTAGEAVGGELALEYVMGDQRVQVA